MPLSVSNRFLSAKVSKGNLRHDRNGWLFGELMCRGHAISSVESASIIVFLVANVVVTPVGFGLLGFEVMKRPAKFSRFDTPSMNFTKASNGGYGQSCDMTYDESLLFHSFWSANGSFSTIRLTPDDASKYASSFEYCGTFLSDSISWHNRNRSIYLEASEWLITGKLLNFALIELSTLSAPPNCLSRNFHI